MNWIRLNVIISILGAGLNFWIAAHERNGLLFAIVGVLLVLRAVRYGFRLRGTSPHH